MPQFHFLRTDNEAVVYGETEDLTAARGRAVQIASAMMDEMGDTLFGHSVAVEVTDAGGLCLFWIVPVTVDAPATFGSGAQANGAARQAMPRRSADGADRPFDKGADQAGDTRG